MIGPVHWILLALVGWFPAPPRRLDLTRRPSAVLQHAFSTVAGVRELGAGKAVVTDQMEHAIYLVDFSKGMSAVVGRQGDGPGEYRFPMAPLAGPGGVTWVPDASLRRILVLSEDGITGALGTPEAGQPGGLGAARGTDRLGRIYFESNSFDSERGSFADSVAIVRWDPKDGRTELLARISSGGRVILKRPGGNASLARSVTPFPHLDAWAVLPGGGVVIVRQQPFRIDVVEQPGVMRRGAPIPYAPIRVTARDRAAYRKEHAADRVGAVLRGGGGGAGGPAMVFRDEDFPETMPPFLFNAVLTTPEGDIWVGRSRRTGDTSAQYDIFSAAGRVTGIATLRLGASVVGFGSGTVYVARVQSEDDLVILERFAR